MADPPDHFTTLGGVGTGDYRSRGSKFLAFASRLDDEAGVTGVVEDLKALHPKARHWCYAYRIGVDGNRWRANDDGEPANSAGRPILGQIDAAGLTNVLVVVVRYFGGTKLGVPGLIEAYRSAAAEALASAPRVEAIAERSLIIRTDYAHYADLLQAANQPPWRVVEMIAEQEVELRLACPASAFAGAYRNLWLVLAKAYPGEERLEEDPAGYLMEFCEAAKS